MYFSKIAYTGFYVPPLEVDNHQFAQIVDTSDEWIRSRTGIVKRHFSAGENTSDLAAKAAKAILEKGNIDPLDVELILIATVTGDYHAPSTSCLVQDKIGASNAVAFDVSAACSGFVFALSVAEKYIRCGMVQNALVIGAEVLSKFVDFQDRSTCVLFGDGAAGVFLTRSEEKGILAEQINSDGSRAMSLTMGHNRVKHPFFETMEEKSPYITMDGRAIFEFATRQTTQCILQLLDKTGISAQEIKMVVPHQANKRIVEAISRKTKIPLEKFYLNMERFGNTSSASIPIALNEVIEQGLVSKGDKVLIAGFGAGTLLGHPCFWKFRLSAHEA